MQFLYGFIVSLFFGLLAFILRFISLSGVAGGMIFGTIIYGCTGWQGFAIPLTFFIIGSLCTKHGYKKKAEMGIAQEEGGRRGAKHALANILAGTIFAVLAYFINPDKIEMDRLNIAFGLIDLHSALIIAMVGSFATAAADTGSSEIGQVYGKTPINPLTFKRVNPGTEGAISLEGTLFGVFASIIVGLAGLVTGLFYESVKQIPSIHIKIYVFMIISIVAGAFLGNMLESVIGALGGKKLNNELLNFLNTLSGGLFSGVIMYCLWNIV